MGDSKHTIICIICKTNKQISTIIQIHFRDNLVPSFLKQTISTKSFTTSSFPHLNAESSSDETREHVRSENEK